MARTRKCPECKSTVVIGPMDCPHCGSRFPGNWNEADEDMDLADGRRSAYRRMRNGGVFLFALGIVLIAKGVEPDPFRIPPIAGVGVVFIVLGTIGFLAGWQRLDGGR